MQKTCMSCGSSFAIPQEDLDFLERVSPVFNGKKEPIPPPTHCPTCRLRRRLIWRPELHLFQRRSDRSGKMILSMYPPDAPCKVYSTEEWWSDDWDALTYGRAFDFNRPFFEQFKELLSVVPLVARSVSETGNENCDYINSASWNRNCYLIAGGNYNEDCYYGNFVNYCRDCIDCNVIDHCELCYECIDCAGCYDLQYSQYCTNCSESKFLYNCRGCKHCFGSVNLVEKEFVFINEQLSKEEYERRIASLELHRRSRVSEAKAFFNTHRLKFPHKFMSGDMNENVSGNGVLRCKNTFESFDVSDLEDCKYCGWFHKAKSCLDCFAWGFPAEECYECMEIGDGSYRSHWNILTYRAVNEFYTNNCRGTHDVFGCVSLTNKTHCILNKQYTKEEYEEIVPRIINHMRETKEWGEFFPFSVCPLAYNQTTANDYFPLSKEEVLRLGARFAEEPAVAPPAIKEPVPDSIRDVTDDVCTKVFTCEETSKPYKVIQQELKFYRTHDIPIPSRHSWARHMTRLKMRNPRKLWDRECMKCGQKIRTSFDPNQPEIVYCEECYLKKIY